MSKPQLNSNNLNNLSQDEGNTIKTIFGTVIDIIVKVTGGKPTFGKGK